MPVRNRTALAAALLLIACLFATASPALAQNTVTLTIDRIGFEAQGRARDGAWIPVVITVENSGADLKGSVIVQANGDDALVEQPLDLPGGARKQISVLYRAGLNQSSIRVSFIGQNNVLLADDNERLIPTDQSEPLIGVFGGPPGTLAGLTLRGGIQPVLLNMPTDVLPGTDAELANFSVIALVGVDQGAPVTEAQAAALRRWAIAGGVLLIDGGPSSLGLPPALADLAPATFDPALPAASLKLSKVLSSTLVAPVTLSARALTLAGDGSAAAADGETVLLATRRLGAGAVWLTGFDIASLPVDATRPEVWSQIIQPVGFNLWPNSFGFSGFNEGGLGLPAVSTLALLILGYILVVGPLNYLLLRRLDRREWAWGTIPAGVLLFMTITYFFGGGLRGATVTAQHIAIVDASPGQLDGRATVLYGFTGGRRATWNAELPAGLVVGSARTHQFFGDIDNRRPEIQQPSDGRAVLANWVTNVGETRLLAGMGSAPVPYAVEFSGQRIENGLWSAATVTNRGSSTIPRSFLVSGDQYFSVGPLEPGASWSLDKIEERSGFPYIFDGSGDDVAINALISTYDSVMNLTNSGPNLPGALYSQPRLVILDRQPAFAPTLSDGDQGNAVTIYNIYLPTEAQR